MLNDKIMFELHQNKNFSIQLLAALPPGVMCGREVMAVVYINMISKLAAGGKHQIFRKMIAMLSSISSL